MIYDCPRVQCSADLRFCGFLDDDDDYDYDDVFEAFPSSRYLLNEARDWFFPTLRIYQKKEKISQFEYALDASAPTSALKIHTNAFSKGVEAILRGLF